MFIMNLSSTIGFDNQNWNRNISGTAYLSDMFLYEKQTGGTPISAHIKHITVALIWTEI